MANSSNARKRKGLISEDDAASLLKRYSATQVLAVLREIAQFPDVKIDWDALVKKTSTGISNAREYQMLWRHLAYCGTLTEKVEEEANLLDDDSDLEYELEAFPPVSDEAALEAAACVKVLLSSGLLDDSGPPNQSTIDAALTINIPNDQASKDPLGNPDASCSKGTNIIVPVSVQKQPTSSTTTAEGLDGIGSAAGGLPPRRKRKPWTEEEDLELIAAVQKCGERNWANILKGDFKGDRTASQLSQRWAILRKRQANLNLGAVSNLGDSQLSETQLATRRAVSLALDMPMFDSLKAAPSLGVKKLVTPSSSTAVAAAPAATLERNEKPTIGNSIAPQTPQPPAQTVSTLSKGTSNSTSPKSRITTKKPILGSVKSSSGPNPLIQAAAVAAGARIAPPGAVKSLLKAAQSKNAVHIRPGGTPNHSGIRPNVHYFRTGLTSASPPASTYSPGVPSIPPLPAVTVQNPPPVNAPTSSISGESQPEVKTTNEEEVKPAEEMKVESSVDTGKDCGQEVKVSVTDPEVDIDKKTTESLPKVEQDENDKMDVDDNQIESKETKTNSPEVK